MNRGIQRLVVEKAYSWWKSRANVVTFCLSETISNLPAIIKVILSIILQLQFMRLSFMFRCRNILLEK